MNRDDALTIVGMVVAAWPGGEWTSDEMEAYARGIMDLDAQPATTAVLLAQKSEKFRPSVAVLREYALAEGRRLAESQAEPKTPEPVGPRVISDWAKVWMVARFKHQDFRFLPEQMPELRADEIPDPLPDEVRAQYAEEASEISAAAFWKMLGQLAPTQ